MKLYLVHCGFYDQEIGEGIYESHTNFFVAAESFEEARSRARSKPEFQEKRMHVDGMQEILVVDGCRVHLEEDPGFQGRSSILNFKHRDLASRSGSRGNQE